MLILETLIFIFMESLFLSMCKIHIICIYIFLVAVLLCDNSEWLNVEVQVKVE